MILFFPVAPYFFLAYFLKLTLQGWAFFSSYSIIFISWGTNFVCCFSILPLSGQFPCVACLYYYYYYYCYCQLIFNKCCIPSGISIYSGSLNIVTGQLWVCFFQAMGASTVWTTFSQYSFVFIYLSVCIKSQQQCTGSLIFTAACGIFSSVMQTHSYGMCDPVS